MRIMVRTLRGDRVALDVDGASTTVAQAKGMVMARERVPVAMQRLFFAGCHLDDDDRTLAGYGVQHDSVLFLGLRLRAADTTPCQEEMNRLQVPAASMTVKKEELQQETHVHDHGHGGANDGGSGRQLEKAKARKPVSRRALRKILSRLHVDTWTRQHDAKLLDLLQRRTAGHGGERTRSVGDLTGEDWSAVRVELNAATGSAFSVEVLQRRVGEFRRELESVGARIKSHPPFGYDPRRRVVVAEEDDWKRYTLEENPGAVVYEGRSEHLGRLQAIFTGDGRAGGGVKSRESRPKRYLNKLLHSFGIRCKL